MKMIFVKIFRSFRYINSSVLNNSFKFQLVNDQFSSTRHSSSTHTIDMEKEKEAFKNMLPAIISSLHEDPKLLEVPEVTDWMKKMLENTVTGGKCVRGLTTVLTYKILQEQDKITEESLKLARTLGWCVEMFQTYCMIVDDIMDNSVTRRGSPCWYRRPDVGLVCAINDSIIVNNALFQLLRNNFANSPNYVNMIHTVNESLWHTAVGQQLDHKTAQNKKDFSKFTVDRYFTIIKYKTAYYTFCLPINLGMLLVGNVDQEVLKQSLAICLEIGKLFQIQDDFIDCFGNEHLTGKAGSDIQEGKCSWLAVNALLLCNDAQRIVFKACYGSNEPAHIERIKRLYEDVKLPELYRHQERVIYDDVLDLMSALPDEAARKLFNTILDLHYKRKY